MAVIRTRNGVDFIIDDEDVELVSKFIWVTRQANYPQSSHFGRTVFIHRLLLGLDHTDKRVVDHINGNSLDNRRENLRACSTRQNLLNKGPNRLNKTGFKGVSRTNRSFKASLTLHLKTINLGHYKTPEEAAEAYDLAAIKYHGEFAWLNFPKQKYIDPNYNPPAKIHPRSKFVKRSSGKFSASGTKGIAFIKSKNHYRVGLTVNKTFHRLGCFKDLETAKMVLENFVNDPSGPYQCFMREVGLAAG